MEWTLANVLAVWGAVLSTALGVVRVLDLIRERPRLRVWGDRVWLSCAAFPERTEYYCFIAVNSGRRPVTVNGCFVEMPNGEREMISPPVGFVQPLPKKLEIGEQLAYIVPPGPVHELRWSEPGPRGVLFTDAAQNEYRGPMNYSVEPRAKLKADGDP